jgi:hypothetical protein
MLDLYDLGLGPTPIVSVFGLSLGCAPGGGDGADCHHLHPLHEEVAASTETYEGDICVGLIDYPVHVPSLHTTSPGAYAPLLPPSVALSVLEAGLASAAQPPATLSSACLTSFRKLTCGQSYRPTETVEVFGLALDLPRFPARSLCEAYNRDCAGFIQQARAADPPLDVEVNCTALGSIGDRTAPMYPVSDQVVLDMRPLLLSFGVPSDVLLDVEEAGAHTFEVATSVHAFDKGVGAAYREDPSCPYGFVVPDHPNDPRVTIIAGTGCAPICPLPFYSSGEDRALQLLINIVSAIGMAVATFNLTSYLMFAKKRKQYIILAFLFNSFMVASNFFIVMVAGRGKLKASLCYDNSIPSDQGDGGLCLFQSIFLSFFGQSACTAWLCQSIDIYMRIIRMEQHTYTRFFYRYAFVIYGIPSCYLAIALGLNVFGYYSPNSWCLYSKNTTKELSLFYSLVIICAAIGFYLMARVIHNIVLTSRLTKKAADSRTQLLRVLRVPILFVLMFLVLWVNLFAFRTSTIVETDALEQAFFDWVVCIFGEFSEQGGVAGGDAYLDVCGEYPDKRLSPAFVGSITLILMGQSILAFLIFGIMDDLRGLWKQQISIWWSKLKVLASRESPNAYSKNYSEYNPNTSVQASSHYRASSSQFARKYRPPACTKALPEEKHKSHRSSSSSRNTSASKYRHPRAGTSASSSLGRVGGIAGHRNQHPNPRPSGGDDQSQSSYPSSSMESSTRNSSDTSFSMENPGLEQYPPS